MDNFSPPVHEWLRSRFPGPTDAQHQVWPRAMEGENLLLCSPTGTGKTLAAFLCGIDALISGRWTRQKPSLLYISPLKALNQDVRLNLLEPLGEIRGIAAARGEEWQEIRVESRSGDTSQYHRRRMLEKPPQILITTPESLNIMLANSRARLLFSDLQTVILDEIHAVAGSKRGVHLVSALERLTEIAGDFQRIALSATLANPERVAAFASGFTASGEARPMRIIRSVDRKELRLEVELIPEPDRESPLDADRDTPWKRLAERLLPLVRQERSTLIFVNSRRLSERLSFLLNRLAEEEIAYAHHGSLSKEIRESVEERMKSGRLNCIVATNSLELGIDIGFLDQIILVQTPISLASAIQKIGRAGHRVGAVSRARLFCSHGRDLLDGLALARSVKTGEIEEVKPVEGGLDVLAQIIVSEALGGEAEAEKLYALLHRSYPFRNLSLEEYREVVEMLTGYYRGARIPKLPIRIREAEGRLEALPGTSAAYYSSGGTIPDRGYFSLRKAGSGTPIGELDEEFVWERKVGDVFSFGNRMWRIQALTPQTVEVVPSDAPADTTTFFRADPLLKGNAAYRILGELIEAFQGQRNPEQRFGREFGFSPEASARLASWLGSQETATGAVHRRRIVMEETRSAKTGGFLRLTFLHTLWGGAVNAPLALALASRFADDGVEADVVWDNDSILISSLDPLPYAAEQLLPSGELIELILRGLSRHGIFGARFREAAGRALLLPRGGFNRRTPLWLNRLRAQRLYAVLAKRPGFPLIREALRECMQDLFEIPRLQELLTECGSGEIEIARVRTDSPSPLCSGALWDQINAQVYSDDTPAAQEGVSLEWAERIAAGEFERPRIPKKIVEEFLSRLQRRAAGYRPENAAELEEILRERLLIPLPVWRRLADGIETPPGRNWTTLQAEEEAHSFVAFADQLPYLAPQLRSSLSLPPLHGREKNSPEDEDTAERELRLRELFSAWLYYLGPVTREALIRNAPFEPQATAERLEALIDADEILAERIIEGSDALYLMHGEAYRELLSFARARHRIDSAPLGNVADLPGLLFLWQGGGGDLDTEEVLALLAGLPLPCGLWESAVLPARIPDYRPALLDQLLSRREIRWAGGERRRISFYWRDEADLCGAVPQAGERLLPSPGAFTFWELSSLYPQRGLEELARNLIEEVWRGGASADSYAPLRAGIARNFRAPKISQRSRPRRRGFADWRASLPLEGNWYRPEPRREPVDALDALEATKERVRILFGRYPILSREILHREKGSFRWGAIFKALRLMEFSGEVISGEFMAGLPGLQFILKEELGRIRSLIPEARAPFLLHVSDPASAAGIPLDSLKEIFPDRRGDLWMRIRDGRCRAAYNSAQGDLKLYETAEPVEAILAFRPLLTNGLLERIDLATVDSRPLYELPGFEAAEAELLKAGFVRGLKSYTLWP